MNPANVRVRDHQTDILAQADQLQRQVVLVWSQRIKLSSQTLIGINQYPVVARIVRLGITKVADNQLALLARHLYLVTLQPV